MAVDPVHVVAPDDGRAHHRVDRVEDAAVLRVALAHPIPDQRRVRMGLGQPQHDGAAPLGGHEQVRPALHDGRDRHAHVDDVGDLPVDRAGLGVERADRARVPDDELPGAGRVDEDRRRVARLPVGGERLPEDLAGQLVEGDDLGVGLAADETDEPVAVHERRAGDAPRGDGGVEVADVVRLPQHAAVRHAERQQVPRGADGVDAVAVHGRRGARAGRVDELQPGVVGVPLAGPEHAAGLLVEGEQALDHRRAARVRAPGVGHEDAAVRHGRARVAAADRHAPGGGQSAGGKLVEDAGVGPDPQAAGAAPLRPVVRGQRRGGGDDRDGGDEQRNVVAHGLYRLTVGARRGDGSISRAPRE